ncbi:MAG: LCP family protein [Clostridia bacterium]|nr:LCP family protein [Clostridia bacterium]
MSEYDNTPAVGGSAADTPSQHHSSRRHGSNKVTVILWIVWAVQFLAEAVAFIAILRLNMLPNLLLGLVAAGFVLMLVFTLCFFLVKKRSGRHRRMSGLNIAGIVISALIVIGCIVGCWAIGVLNASLKNVTQPPDVQSEAFGVYVLKESPHSTLPAMTNLRFGVSAQNQTDTALLMQNVEEAAGQQLRSEVYQSNTELVKALYDGDMDAIVISVAMAALLEESEYDDFEDRTRQIYEFMLDSDPTVPEDTQAEKNKDFEKSDEAYLIYLSGSDTRNERLTTSRSDVNILVAVNLDTHQVMMVNTPRDYYVQTTVSGDAYDKLTHAGVYGIKCSIGTLEHLYGVGVDYYAQINFTGFEKLIDAIGGVTVYSDVAFTTKHGGYQIHEGNNDLDGAAALGFARERYALSGGDNDRGKNQMKIISAVIDKMSATTVLTNYASIMDSLNGMFVTNVPVEEISRLVKRQLTDNAKWTVHSYAVTGRGGFDVTYSMPQQNLYVMYQSEVSVDKAQILLKKVLAGEAVTDADLN